jgi:hypothetical protein
MAYDRFHAPPLACGEPKIAVALQGGSAVLIRRASQIRQLLRAARQRNLASLL